MIWSGGNSPTVCCPDHASPALWVGKPEDVSLEHQESLLGCALSNTPQFEIAALEFDPMAFLGPAVLSSISSRLRKVPPFCCVSCCIKLGLKQVSTSC